ncbi:hypothetical protein C1H76_0783 [Elsinoe australis]|uniref:Uncharacterized protein n=1 Tax=Elsinoe australis TaxID=40998 RepID=A0A4U7B6J3_9PEZI|nr:hypothetical protein C1H76_0783 [Elsinoe australis]
MAAPSTPTTPMSTDSPAFMHSSMQSPIDTHAWRSDAVLSRAQSNSSQSSQSVKSSFKAHYQYDQSQHSAVQSQVPPIPARAPGHALHTPKQALKKRRSPRVNSLRELRARDSEAQLRSIYEAHTLAYLNDAIEPYRRATTPGRSKWSFSDSSGDESIKEEAEEEEEFFMAPEKIG